MCGAGAGWKSLFGELGLGGFDGGGAAVLPFDSYSGLDCAPLFCGLFALFEFGGVNGRNPEADLVCVAGATPLGRFMLFELTGVSGTDGPRASLGDMAGA